MTSATTRPARDAGGRRAEDHAWGLVWFGVAVLVLNAIDQMFFIGAYPLRSLAIIALDVVAIYWLCAYGGPENAGGFLTDLGSGALDGEADANERPRPGFAGGQGATV